MRRGKAGDPGTPWRAERLQPPWYLRHTRTVYGTAFLFFQLHPLFCFWPSLPPLLAAPSLLCLRGTARPEGGGSMELTQSKPHQEASYRVTWTCGRHGLSRKRPLQAARGQPSARLPAGYPRAPQPLSHEPSARRVAEVSLPCANAKTRLLVLIPINEQKKNPLFANLKANVVTVFLGRGLAALFSCTQGCNHGITGKFPVLISLQSVFSGWPLYRAGSCVGWMDCARSGVGKQREEHTGVI